MVMLRVRTKPAQPKIVMTYAIKLKNVPNSYGLIVPLKTVGGIKIAV